MRISADVIRDVRWDNPCVFPRTISPTTGDARRGGWPVRPHVVVGFDGSPGSRDALALALVLLDSEPERSAEMTVLSVPDADLYGLHPSPAHASYERSAADESRTRLADARGMVGSRPCVSFAVRRDRSPACALQLVARQHAAAAIVVGCSRAGLVGRAFEGSVCEQTLLDASCPVYVAPVGYADPAARRELDTITVGFDGSPTSLDSLRFAARLARRHGAVLRLIRVLGPPAGHPGEDAPAGASPTARRAAALADLHRRSAHLDGPTVELEVIAGDPGEVLASPGAETDLLVVGSRGFGPVEAARLGGVSAQLAHGCIVPVVVVPRSRTDGPDAAEVRYVAAMR